MTSHTIRPLIGIGSDILAPAAAGERELAYAYTTYIEALVRAGAVPLIVPPQAAGAAELLDILDGVLLAGGNDCDPALYGEECHPSVAPMDVRRQSSDTTLARLAREHDIPALGICLGMQVMNVVAGGSLLQDIASQHETTIEHASLPSDRTEHQVIIAEGTHLAAIVGAGESTVNSSHHQAVRKLGDGLRQTAVAPDGIVEGLEDPSHPFYIGVQWHPEDMSGEASSDTLFAAFIEAARARARAKQAATEPSRAASIATQ
jgi:putative glutamine amidotransferase